MSENPENSENNVAHAEPIGTPSRINPLRELASTLLSAVLIAILINLFLAQSTIVLGQSMESNLHQDQRLVIEKVTYRFHGPQRGDIVVLKPPTWKDAPPLKKWFWFLGGYMRVSEEDLPLIKRVIGLPGERIEVRENSVYIDGQKLDEPYLDQVTPGAMAPVIVPPFHVFVLGDNRMASYDSRYFGPVPSEDILGRAWLSYWPLSQLRVLQ